MAVYVDQWDAFTLHGAGARCPEKGKGLGHLAFQSAPSAQALVPVEEAEAGSGKSLPRR